MEKNYIHGKIARIMVPLLVFAVVMVPPAY